MARNSAHPDDRWHGVREELRRVILSLFSAAGGVIGLWFGWLSVPTQTKSPHLGPALREVLVPMMWRVGVGVLAGALVGLAICLAIPWLRPRPHS